MSAQNVLEKLRDDQMRQAVACTTLLREAERQCDYVKAREYQIKRSTWILASDMVLAAMSATPSVSVAPESKKALEERIAQLTAHRACHSAEHDPANGRIHGYCIVCGVPWPCEVTKVLKQEPQPESGAEALHQCQVGVIDPGHAYRLPCFDGGQAQDLMFMKREGPGYPGNVGTYPGTNLQSVLRACLDRVIYLHAQIPHDNNLAITCHLKHSLLALEQRAIERHGGNPRSITLDKAAFAPMCGKCGHVICGHAPSVPEQPESDSASGVSSEKCQECGISLNEGEAKTFTVCDDCWTKTFPPSPSSFGAAQAEDSRGIKSP